MSDSSGRLRALFSLVAAAAMVSCGGGSPDTEHESAQRRKPPAPSPAPAQAPSPTPAPAPSPAPSPAPAPAPAPAPSPAPAPAPAGTAVLSWDAETDPAVIGYRVYYGTAPGIYLQAYGAGVDAGSTPTYTVNALQSGVTYYFAVTAYDALGNESGYSSEAMKTIP